MLTDFWFYDAWVLSGVLVGTVLALVGCMRTRRVLIAALEREEARTRSYESRIVQLERENREAARSIYDLQQRYLNATVDESRSSGL